MTAKGIMQDANSIRIIGNEYADIYEFGALSCAWYTQGDYIDADCVESAVTLALRNRPRRVFRHCDDGYVTITIINNIGEEC